MPSVTGRLFVLVYGPCRTSPASRNKTSQPYTSPTTSIPTYASTSQSIGNEATRIVYARKATIEATQHTHMYERGITGTYNDPRLKPLASPQCAVPALMALHDTVHGATCTHGDQGPPLVDVQGPPPCRHMRLLT